MGEFRGQDRRLSKLRESNTRTPDIWDPGYTAGCWDRVGTGSGHCYNELDKVLEAVDIAGDLATQIKRAPQINCGGSKSSRFISDVAARL